MDEKKEEIKDIVIIGSGPSSLLCVYYFMLYYPDLKIALITPKMEIPRCTYGIFMSQIEDVWLLKHIKKEQLFSKIMDIGVNCSNDIQIFKDGKLSKNIINIDDRYGILNNDYFYFNILQKIESSKNVRIILGTATQISNKSEKTIYYYNKQKILHSIISKFVVEGIGNYRPIGIRYREPYNIYRQSFVGYKIKMMNSLESIGVKDRCVLINWFNKFIFDDQYNDSYIKPSFCYIVPLDDKTILFEETILILSDKEIESCGSLIDIYSILEYRLNKRIKMMGFNNIELEIIGKETNTIILNKSIPDSSSKSFGIGQCGNMINITSGYTLGYNIYHMKEICDTIVASGFNTKETYNSYWNYKRYIINKINSIGQMLLDNMDSNELTEFHKNYFLKIVNNKNNNYNHRVLFLNCDNNINIRKLVNTYKGYFEFPFKFILKIAKNTIKYLFGIV